MTLIFLVHDVKDLSLESLENLDLFPLDLVEGSFHLIKLLDNCQKRRRRRFGLTKLFRFFDRFYSWMLRCEFHAAVCIITHVPILTTTLEIMLAQLSLELNLCFWLLDITLGQVLRILVIEG